MMNQGGMGRTFGFCVAAGALVVTTGAADAADSTPRQLAPPDLGFVYSAESPSKMQFKCRAAGQAPSGRARLDCSFIQLMIMPPKTAAEVAKKVAEDERELRADAAKNPAKFWADTCRGSDKPIPADDMAKMSEEERRAFEEFVTPFRQACTTRDVGVLARASAATHRDGARTCTLELANDFQETLERLDSNTWQGVSGPRGICNLTVIVTMWQDPKNPGVWNYKQVRSIPENERGPLCATMQRVAVSEMRWDGKKHWDLGCQKMKL